MSQSHFKAVISTESDNLSAPLARIVPNPSPSMLLFLLPPCLILLAIDAALRKSHRPSEDCVSLEMVSNEHKPSAQQVVTEHEIRDKGVIRELQRPKNRHRMLSKQRNFAHHRQRLRAYNPGLVTIPLTVPCRDGEPKKLGSNGGVEPSFTAFCDHLLLQNEIWKQQREIKALRRSLDSMSMTNCSNAFKAFCDRLILSNSIWKLEKEVSQLTAETEMIKRSRVAAVTRAAKKMVLDVRKERLIEEFVKGLMADLTESRQTIKSLRAAHEREIEEMAGEWRKDYQRLSDEVKRLRLAQETRLIEQELSNTMESELIERSALLYQKAGILLDGGHGGEMGFPSHAKDCIAYPGDDTETLSGSDLDLEEMSTMSTSTCVGSTGQQSPNSKSSFERKFTSHQRIPKPAPLKIPRESSSTFLRISPVTKSPTRKLDSGPYVGFSFNPLFFVPADASKEDLTNKDCTKHVLSLKGQPQSRRSAINNPNSTDAIQSPKPPKRVQWK